MSGEVVAINASLLAVYDHTQRKKEAFVTSNRVEFELTPELSGNLPLRDYGRFARHPFEVPKQSATEDLKMMAQTRASELCGSSAQAEADRAKGPVLYPTKTRHHKFLLQ